MTPAHFGHSSAFPTPGGAADLGGSYGGMLMCRQRPSGLRSAWELERWWIGVVSGAVLGAFPLHPVCPVLGAGAFSGGHGQDPIRAGRGTVRQDQRGGGDGEVGEEQRTERFGGVGAPAR